MRHFRREQLSMSRKGSVQLACFLANWGDVFIILSLSLYGSTALLNLCRFFSFLIVYTVDRATVRGISPSQSRYLHTEQHKQNKHTQYRHSWLEWDSNPDLSVREAKTVHTLESAVTVIGLVINQEYGFIITAISYLSA
jgi:hypothetical protein